MMSGRWQDSVPVDWSDRASRPEPQRQESFGSIGRNSSTVAGNTASLARRPSDLNMQTNNEHDPPRSRRPSVATTAGSVAGKKRSLRNMKNSQRRPGGLPDDSAWIHRDKLAQIEIQEMEEAGIYVPVKPSHRSRSARRGSPDRRSPEAHSRTRSRDELNENSSSGEEANHPDYLQYQEQDGTNGTNVAHHANQDLDQGLDGEDRGYSQSSDYNYAHDTTEELGRARSSSIPRPGTSRIPVSRQSPMALPHDVLEREKPLTRSSEGSGTWDELQYARKTRSGSIGSQVLLDDPDAARPSSSHLLEQDSSTKGKSPSKSTIKSRKTSGSTTGRGGRTARGTSSSRRPGSSSNSRPPTSQRSSPEGDPPWLASMYKPDPRLPPDQQMLPTHAKRLAQERWEREGKTGSVYDTEFNLLNDEDPSQPKAPTLSQDQNHLDPATGPDNHKRRSLSPRKRSPLPSPAHNEQGNTWPLPSPGAKSDAKSDNASVRPGTSGGYKITPTIAPSPQIQSSKPVQSPRSSQQPQGAVSNPTPRVPDLDEKDEPKQKGCCCVIM